MEWKHCPLSKDGQLYVNENTMFFCIIIQRKVIKLSYSANTNICVSVSSDITDWDSINWNRVERYVDKQQKRIYKAEVNKDSILNINLAEDKGLFEPYVFNDTRAVLRRVQRSNPLFLSDNETEVCVG